MQLLLIAALFAFKVAYAFAVDHEPPGSSGVDSRTVDDRSERRG